MSGVSLSGLLLRVRVYLSVCLFVCRFLPTRVSEKPHVQITKFSVHLAWHVICGRGSVLHCRQRNRLCTSGFVDDVMFSHN